MVLGVCVKRYAVVILIMLMLILAMLSACDKTEFSDEVVSISVRELSDAYFVGDDIVFENIVFDYTYADGRTGTRSAAEALISGISTASPGEYVAILTFGGKSAEFTYRVGGIVYYTAGEGGYISGRGSQLIAYGGTGTYVEAVAYDGYLFSSWSDGMSLARRREAEVIEWDTFNASFTRIEYVLNFYSEQGNLLATTTLYYGEIFTQLTAPEGWQIEGYYNKATGARLTEYTVQSSMDIEVRYRPLALTVSYDGGAETARVFDYGSPLSFPDAIVPAGKTLLHWEDVDGLVYSVGFVLTNDLELFAVFVEGTHSVTLVSQGQTVSIIDILHGFPLGLIAVTAPTHKEFLRWEDDEGIVYSKDTLIYEDVTLTAIWTDKYYDVVLELGGGEFDYDSYSLLSGAVIMAFLTSPTRFGYTFGGWYADSEYSVEFVFGAPIASDVHIYAYWIPRPVSVKYVYMYGSIEKNEMHRYGESLTLLCLSRPEYDFLGWFTEQTFANRYEDGDAIEVLSLVLYAKWDIKKFNVTIEPLIGGSVVVLSSLPITYGETLRYRVLPAAGHNAVEVRVNNYIAVITQTGAFERSFTNVTSDIVLSAVFERYEISVSVSAGTGGSASPSGVVSVLYGDSLTVYITPDTGFAIGTVKVNQVTRTVTGGTLIIDNITAAATVSVQFIQKYYSVSAILENASSTLGSGTSVTEGSSLNVTVNANDMHMLLYVRYRGLSSGTVHTIAITDPDKKTATIALTDIRENIVIEASARISAGSVNASAETGGTITPSGVTQVAFDEQINFTITPNDGYYVSDVKLNGISQGSVTNYVYVPQSASGDVLIAYFELIPFYIQSSVSGNGFISPSGVSVARYGESPVYTVTAGVNYHIDYLLIDGVHTECSGKSAEYTFENVTAGHTIRAVFAIDTYSVNINLTGSGRVTLGSGAGAINITSSGSVTAEYGTALYLFADIGSYISALSVNGVASDPTLLVGGYIGQIVDNISIDAEFTTKMYTVTQNIVGQGTLTAPATVLHGSAVAVEFAPDTGYRFKKLMVGGSEVAPTGNEYLIANVTGNITVTVYFEIIVLSVTVTASGSGSATSVQSVNYGDEVVITLTAAEHWHIASIDASHGDYSSALGLSEYVITMPALTTDFALHAVFAPDMYQISFDIGAGGGIQLTSGETYRGSFTLQAEHGSTVSYYILADEGKQISTLLRDGESVVVSTLVEFYDIAEPHSVAVTFVSKTYNVSAMVTGGGNGTITLSQTTVTHGGSVTVTLNPASGYKLGALKVNGVTVTVVGNKYVISGITSNTTVNATYVPA